MQLTQALAADKGLTSVTIDEQAGTHALATGSILLLAIQKPEGVAYKYDDTNPDARIARLLADGRYKRRRAGGRQCMPRMIWFTRRARPTRFVVPGCWG